MKWEKVELNSICDLENGYAFKSKDYIEESNVLICRMSNIRPEGGFNILYNPKYAPENFKELHSKYLLVDGDIIIAMTDMATDPKILGVPTIVRTNGFSLLLNQRVGKLVIRNKEEIHVPYLQYVLNRPQVKSYYKKFAGGGVQINIGKKQILGVKIPLPPLPTQKAIAELLDTADSLRRTTAEQLQQLDKLAESVFLEMFGDSYLNTKDWEVKFLKDITTHIIDCPHSTPKYVDYKSDYPCIRTTELKKGLIDWSSMKYLDEEGHIKRVRRLEPTFGDIIYGREGSFGEAAIVPKNVNISLGQRVVLFRPNYELVNSSYLLALLRSSGLYQQALRKTSGSTVGHINIKDIKKYSCMIPPLKLQNEFAKIIANIEEQKAVLKESLRDSEDMFNGLLQEVFS